MVRERIVWCYIAVVLRRNSYGKRRRGRGQLMAAHLILQRTRMLCNLHPLVLANQHRAPIPRTNIAPGSERYSGSRLSKCRHFVKLGAHSLDSVQDHLWPPTPIPPWGQPVGDMRSPPGNEDQSRAEKTRGPIREAREP